MNRRTRRWSSARERCDEEPTVLDHEIAHLTKSLSTPHKHFRRVLPGKVALSVSPVKMLGGRESNFSGRGRFMARDCCHLESRYTPVNRHPSVVDKMHSGAYISQFSEDGSLFVGGFQDSHIRIYNVDRGWKIQKDIRARSMRWTITDASLSPDRRYLAYSSITPTVHIVDVGSATTKSTANVTEIHEGLEFSSDSADYEDDSFGIFSVKFSKDGRELVAASNNESIYIYDLQGNRLSLSIPAHENDVNAVCFADETGHLIYSGSDDTLCKVWDRRCLGATKKPAGMLIGHLEGVTFLDTRGDGRYLISNGKDQCIKLWDIRKMSSRTNYTPRSTPHWDYRWMPYPERARNRKNPDDISLTTYKGHTVLLTLIRCYFSPAHSTGQKYIYTGSADNSVYIYDLVRVLSSASFSEYHLHLYFLPFFSSTFLKELVFVTSTRFMDGHNYYLSMSSRNKWKGISMDFSLGNKHIVVLEL
ncbi:OLC1v1020275C3 [Oldenlandia corymbosa var. corymbosa]|uniref:OLC1v1020275C3 n=1 Tax=Oldenlandia corymbosa var. corymbosa TaxID=529605 RepID=A0AAV1EG62_OLDCO|nr:OLC1v1020275C3 [Oldenlandia corymbosa var. corymbosa]